MAEKISSPFPPPNLPFDGPDGMPNRIWVEFLMRMFKRTGGSTGGDGQLTFGDVIGLEADIAQPVDMAAQVAELGIALQQAFAAISAVRDAVPAFGEVSAARGIDQLFPDVVGVPSNPGLLPEQMIMGAPRAMPDALTELVFPSVSATSSAQAPASVTPGSSPYKYTATSRQALHIAGGTVTALSYARGATTLAITVSAGGQLIELNAGDAMVITYSSAPTLTVMQR